MEKKEINTIYHIQNRASDWIFHLIVYMIGGLRHIKTKIYNPSFNPAGQSFNHNIIDRNVEISYPIQIYIQNFKNEGLNAEILEHIKDYYKYIPDLTPYISDTNTQIIDNFGEPILSGYPHVDLDVYKFLRNLFLKDEHQIDQNKKIFLTRKNSHLLPGNKGDRRRQILNEDELVNELNKYNIEKIQLEDLSFSEKIKLFNTSKLIISPHSGGLVMSICANTQTQIIELCPEFVHYIQDNYKEICESLNISWNRFHTTNVDNNDNMIVDIEKFTQFLETYI